jgi:H+/Cl- antiporter ClcA
MTEASTGSSSRTALPAGPVWRAGLLAALAATVVNAVAWVLVQQVLDAGLEIPAQPGSTELSALPLGAVIFVTAFAGLVGTAVLWLLTRRGPSGIRLWAILAAAVGALSALTAFGLDTTTARQLGLVLFHLLATVVMIAVARQQLARWSA